MKYFRIFPLLLCVMVLLAGCKTKSNATKEVLANGEALVGEMGKGSSLGVVPGSVVNSTVGALIVKKLDTQKKALEATLPSGISVSAIEGGGALKVVFDSDVLFAANSSTLKGSSSNALNSLVANLNENPDTDIKIIGYTDNTGKEEYNQILSAKRAKSIYTRMKEQGVSEQRMKYDGKGSQNPIAGNDTPESRAKNRRMEVLILAGEKMIQNAQQGILK